MLFENLENLKGLETPFLWGTDVRNVVEVALAFLLFSIYLFLTSLDLASFSSAVGLNLLLQHFIVTFSPLFLKLFFLWPS